MQRRRITVRGLDEDAWEMLCEVREYTRTQTGALLGDAIRFWYESLEEGDPEEDED